MRSLLVFAAAVLFAAPAQAEKIGLQSVRGTGERIGLQRSLQTSDKVGLQAGLETGEKVGLQSPEAGIHDAIAEELWSLSVRFEADDFSIDSDNYKQLRRVADLLKESPTTHIYMQGYAGRNEKAIDGRDLAQQRAEVALIYLLLMGVNVEVVELVQPDTNSEARLALQLARHRERVVAEAKEAGTKPAPEAPASVRFGVVEQH